MTDEGDTAPDEGLHSDAGPGWTVVEAARADDQPEWELFLRESPTEPLRHAGSVTAPSADVAHERATGLFPEATTLWCCPAGEVARFTERDLGGAYRGSDEETADGDGTDTRGRVPAAHTSRVRSRPLPKMSALYTPWATIGATTEPVRS